MLGIAYRGVIGVTVRDVGYCVSWSDWSDGTKLWVLRIVE